MELYIQELQRQQQATNTIVSDIIDLNLKMSKEIARLRLSHVDIEEYVNKLISRANAAEAKLAILETRVNSYADTTINIHNRVCKCVKDVASLQQECDSMLGDRK